jgi:hypothetical protein
LKLHRWPGARGSYLSLNRGTDYDMWWNEMEVEITVQVQLYAEGERRYVEKLDIVGMICIANQQ